MKFGLSTRLYLFGGPEELRPEEGLSKQQKKQLAALEVMLPRFVCHSASQQQCFELRDMHAQCLENPIWLCLVEMLKN